MQKRLFIFVLLTFLLVNACGCAALVIGTVGAAGTAVWLSGKLSQELDATRDDVSKAVKSALESMTLEITKETRTEDVTQVISRYTDGSTIWIDIRPVSGARSNIEIRVGMGGDKEASRKLLDRIKEKL